VGFERRPWGNGTGTGGNDQPNIPASAPEVDASMDRFIRWCTRTSAALGVVGLASVLIPGGNRLLGACALALAALLIVMVGLVALIDLEERERAQLTDAALPDPAVDEVAMPAEVDAPAMGAVADAAPPVGPDLVHVVFRLPAAVQAQRACVVGEFNGWSPTAHPMAREGDELVARLALVRGRTYRYRYLLDGDRWENDWNADAYVPNGFGGEDSVLDLTASTPPRGQLVT
jgi:hypothetical protein